MLFLVRKLQNILRAFNFEYTRSQTFVTGTKTGQKSAFGGRHEFNLPAASN